MASAAHIAARVDSAYASAGEDVFQEPVSPAASREHVDVEILAAGAEAFDDAVAEAPDLAFGPPILRPTSLRDFYAFERHVATMWKRRDMPVPEAWYRLLRQVRDEASPLASLRQTA